MSRRKSRGFTFAEGVAICGILGVLAAILYPVFARTDTTPRVLVIDSVCSPIPDAVLKFRDDNGATVLSATTNAKGEFRQKHMRRYCQDRVAGFCLIERHGSSGGAETFVYSPFVPQHVRFRYPNGLPAPHLAVTPYLERPLPVTDAPPPALTEVTTDENGCADIGPQPAAARIRFGIEDPTKVSGAIVRVGEAGGIDYFVTVEKPAGVAGIALDENGIPLRNGQIYLERKDTDYHDFATDPLLAIRSDGSFDCGSLSPGVYGLDIAERSGWMHLGPHAQTVTIHAGETRRLVLQRNAPRQDADP